MQPLKSAAAVRERPPRNDRWQSWHDRMRLVTIEASNAEKRRDPQDGHRDLDMRGAGHDCGCGGEPQSLDRLGSAGDRSATGTQYWRSSITTSTPGIASAAFEIESHTPTRRLPRNTTTTPPGCTSGSSVGGCHGLRSVFRSGLRLSFFLATQPSPCIGGP